MLTKDQQEHFEMITNEYGAPPEGCTHLDIGDDSESSFMRLTEDNKLFYWGLDDNDDGYWSEFTANPLYLTMYPVPTPPYYNPKDVAFNKRTVKSDGGSSSYYTIPLPAHEIEKIVENGAIETEIIIKYGFGNDFDFGNIQKTLKRLYEISQGGGKEGNTAQYEINKIRYSLAKIEEELNDVK